jgi:hypothetical protein
MNILPRSSRMLHLRRLRSRSHRGASQILVGVAAVFSRLPAGQTDDRFDDYFVNAGELESVSCEYREYHVYSSLIVVWRAWPFGED